MRAELSLLPDILHNPSSSFGGIDVHDHLSSSPMKSNTTCSSGGTLMPAGTNQEAAPERSSENPGPGSPYFMCPPTGAARRSEILLLRPPPHQLLDRRPDSNRLCILLDCRRDRSRAWDPLCQAPPCLTLIQRVWLHTMIHEAGRRVVSAPVMEATHPRSNPDCGSAGCGTEVFPLNLYFQFLDVYAWHYNSSARRLRSPHGSLSMSRRTRGVRVVCRSRCV